MSRKLKIAMHETFIAAIWRLIFAPITPSGRLREVLVPVRADLKRGHARVRAAAAYLRD